jgi:hypothetical protein
MKNFSEKNRSGGRPYKWGAGKTKIIRVPIAFLPEIFALIQKMDERELAKSLITVGHPPGLN